MLTLIVASSRRPFRLISAAQTALRYVRNGVRYRCARIRSIRASALSRRLSFLSETLCRPRRLPTAIVCVRPLKFRERRHREETVFLSRKNCLPLSLSYLRGALSSALQALSRFLEREGEVPVCERKVLTRFSLPHPDSAT